jgi:hypothetical protein
VFNFERGQLEKERELIYKLRGNNIFPFTVIQKEMYKEYIIFLAYKCSYIKNFPRVLVSLNILHTLNGRQDAVALNHEVWSQQYIQIQQSLIDTRYVLTRSAGETTCTSNLVFPFVGTIFKISEQMKLIYIGNL